MSALNSQQAVDEQFLALTAPLARRMARRSITREVALATVLGSAVSALATWGLLASVSLHMTL